MASRGGPLKLAQGSFVGVGTKMPTLDQDISANPSAHADERKPIRMSAQSRMSAEWCPWNLPGRQTRRLRRYRARVGSGPPSSRRVGSYGAFRRVVYGLLE